MFYHQALAKCFSDIGVDVIFGLLGDANLFAMNSFTQDYHKRFIAVGHDGNAVLAAGGYASVTGAWAWRPSLMGLA